MVFKKIELIFMLKITLKSRFFFQSTTFVIIFLRNLILKPKLYFDMNDKL